MMPRMPLRQPIAVNDAEYMAESEREAAFCDDCGWFNEHLKRNWRIRRAYAHEREIINREYEVGDGVVYAIIARSESYARDRFRYFVQGSIMIDVDGIDDRMCSMLAGIYWNRWREGDRRPVQIDN
jgi:hypothetical protein